MRQNTRRSSPCACCIISHTHLLHGDLPNRRKHTKRVKQVAEGSKQEAGSRRGIAVDLKPLEEGSASGVTLTVSTTQRHSEAGPVVTFPYLRGLVERGALLPRRHAPRQGEENAPVLHDQLGHKGHFNEDRGTRRQVSHADGEHVLQRTHTKHRPMG